MCDFLFNRPSRPRGSMGDTWSLERCLRYVSCDGLSLRLLFVASSPLLIWLPFLRPNLIFLLGPRLEFRSCIPVFESTSQSRCVGGRGTKVDLAKAPISRCILVHSDDESFLLRHRRCSQYFPPAVQLFQDHPSSCGQRFLPRCNLGRNNVAVIYRSDFPSAATWSNRTEILVAKTLDASFLLQPSLFALSMLLRRAIVWMKDWTRIPCAILSRPVSLDPQGSLFVPRSLLFCFLSKNLCKTSMPSKNETK